MTLPKIGIILSTTRQGRFADKPAAWLQSITAERTDMSFELIDLRDYPLPMFDWPASPARKPIDIPELGPWRAKIDSLDGYIFITAEYNHSVPAVLKNAMDHLYAEWVRKPAAYVGYGNTGGARAVEHLRNICVELHMAPMRIGVHIGRDPLIAILADGKSLSDFPYLAIQAKAMLDDLSWWTSILKAGREALPSA
jgi:NAD(P)H-dependent FMN reductase